VVNLFLFHDTSYILSNGEKRQGKPQGFCVALEVCQNAFFVLAPHGLDALVGLDPQSVRIRVHGELFGRVPCGRMTETHERRNALCDFGTERIFIPFNDNASVVSLGVHLCTRDR